MPASREEPMKKSLPSLLRSSAALLALAALPATSVASGFTDVVESSGITFRHQYIPGETGADYKINQYDHGAGVLVADFDGDGFDDIYFLNYLGDNALYRNKGDGTFEDVTAKAGLAMSRKISVGGAWGDIDNDGDPDLYVTSYRGGNQLFLNNGDGTFTDITELTGTGYAGHSSSAVFFDFDGDGDLDLYVANIGRFTTDIVDRMLGYYIGFALPKEFFNVDFEMAGEKSSLFRNDGMGRWPDVATEAGVAAAGWNGDVTLADYDLDGDLDLYTTNMFGANTLYRNDGGKFTDVTRETLRRTSWGAVGALFFDADDDGRPDLYVVDMHSDMWRPPGPGWRPTRGYAPPREEILEQMDKTALLLRELGMASAKYDSPFGPTKPEFQVATGRLDELGLPHVFGNTFFFNRGEGRFEEASDRVGLECYWPWGITAGDLDNDGDVDLYVPSGMGYPYFYWPNHLYLNQGDGTFVERAQELGAEPPARGLAIAGADIEGVPFMRSSRAAALLDIDNDGDLDIVVNNFNHEPYLLRNDLPRQNHVGLWLEASRGNRDAIGARVELSSGGRTQHRQVTGAGGYLTQSRRALHFGLGQHSSVQQVRIVWPDGSVQTIEGLEPNRVHKIRQPEPGAAAP
jgi:enediyne biosynthesis protein E4